MDVRDGPTLPEARVVRTAGVEWPRETLVQQVATVLGPVLGHAVTAAGYAVALWPLTASVLLIAALLWAVGVAGGP